MDDDRNDLAGRHLRELSREERIEFCREVLEGLSDLVEGEAPAEFCERIDAVLGECEAFVAYRETLRSTIELAAECREADPVARAIDEGSFRRCVERVRERLGGANPECRDSSGS